MTVYDVLYLESSPIITLSRPSRYPFTYPAQQNRIPPATLQNFGTIPPPGAVAFSGTTSLIGKHSSVPFQLPPTTVPLPILPVNTHNSAISQQSSEWNMKGITYTSHQTRKVGVGPRILLCRCRWCRCSLRTWPSRQTLCNRKDTD